MLRTCHIALIIAMLISTTNFAEANCYTKESPNAGAVPKVNLCKQGKCVNAEVELQCSNVHNEFAVYSNGFEFGVDFKTKKALAKLNKVPTPISQWKCTNLDKLDGCGWLSRKH